MASQRKDRPQRNRKPPKIYGFHVSGQEEDTFTDFEPPSPPHRPVDTRLPFDPQLVEECAFPSLDPVTHVGLGPSEVYKVYRQARREQEVKQMVEYEPLYHERLAQLKQRKQVVGRRDIGEFPGAVADNRSRGRSRGVSVQYANTPEERARWERGREQEFVWAVGESSSEEEDEEKEEEEEEDEDEDDHVQQRDTLMRTSRLLLSVRNANHTKQKEAVAAVERARSSAQSLVSSQGQKIPALPLPLTSVSASAKGKDQKDADGDTVMGGGSSSQSTRQLVVSLPKPRWVFTISIRAKSPRRPTAAEKGKVKETVLWDASRNQSTLGPTQVSQDVNRLLQGSDARKIENATVMVGYRSRTSIKYQLIRSLEQILNTARVAIPTWSSLPANIQYLTTYHLTAIHEPPYSFAQLSTLLSFSTDEIISLLYLINHETRKMIVLDSLSNQLAAIEDIDAVRGALDRLKPQGLVTDSVSSEDIRQGQAFLRFMGLHKVAEWLAEYVGVSNSRDSNEGRHVIKIDGRLLDGDIPAEVAGNVLRRIWNEEQERATRIENARRAEAARASMQPPPLGLVNRSVLELTDRSVQNGKVLTIQEAEQAARRLADFGLLVPQSDHYTVSVNGESVHLEQDLQARRLWNHELEAMRKAQRQNKVVPPARPTLESNEERQPSRPTLDQVAGSSVGNREEHRQGVRETSRGQATLVQQPPPSTGAISSAPVTMDIDSSMNRATRQDKKQQQKGQPSSSANEVDQEAHESQSRNSPTNDYLLSIGIDLSLHKPPPLDTSSGSPTLEERTAAFLAANKATLEAIDRKDEMEARLRRRQPAQGQAHDEEPAISAYGLRNVSEARTLRSDSIYSSRLASEAPSVVPAANTTPTTARGNRQAAPFVANPSGSAHEMSTEIQRQVQVVTEAGASSVAPHNALAGNGNSNQVPTAVTIQREEARPVAVVTPPAPETPASQRKTRIILKVGGRRVTSQSSITFTETPRSEPPVHTSPHTPGRNFSEPTRRHRELSQEISFGDDATDHASSRSSFKQPLPTRRNLFGTTRKQEHASFSPSGTLTASNHIQTGSQVSMPSLVVGGHPTKASSHPSQLQRPSLAGIRDLASTEPGSHRQNELGLAASMPTVIPATISPTQTNPSRVIRAVADRENQQTMRGGATEEVGKRDATRSQVHSEEQGESGP